MLGWFAVLLVAVLVMAPGAFATTVDATVGGSSGYASAWVGKGVLAERTLDFSGSSLTGTAADVFQTITVPAGAFVAWVGYEIEDNGTYTGEDGTATIDIGDGSDTDGWIDGANVQTGQTAYGCSQWTLGAAGYTMVTGITETTYTTVTGITEVTSTICTGLTYQTGSVGGTNFVTNVTALTTSLLSDITPLTASLLGDVVAQTTTVYPVVSAPKPYAAGKWYSASDTIDVLLNNTCDQLKITIRAWIIPISGM